MTILLLALLSSASGQDLFLARPEANLTPISRDEHVALLFGSTVVVNGGWSLDTDFHGGYLNDTWTLDLLTMSWQQLPMQFVPGAISAHVAVPLPSQPTWLPWPSPDLPAASFLVFGGNTGGGGTQVSKATNEKNGNTPVANFRNQVFKISTGPKFEWEEINSGTGTAPPPMVRPSGISRQPGELTIFGGWPGPLKGSYATMLNDVWHFTMSNNSWEKLSKGVGRAKPGVRYHHVAAYDASTDEMIIHGGYALMSDFIHGDHLVYYDDTWHFAFATHTWRKAKTNQAPPHRMGHAAVWNQKDRALTIFGGTNPENGNIGDVWTYRPGDDDKAGTWTQLKLPDGAPQPSGRNCATAVLKSDGELVLYGGEDSATHSDTWMLTSSDGFRTGKWKQLL